MYNIQLLNYLKLQNLIVNPLDDIFKTSADDWFESSN